MGDPLRERGPRLRELAAALKPAVPPYYVQRPDGEERAIGWYMRRVKSKEPLYLGHNSIVAEIFLRDLIAGG